MKSLLVWRGTCREHYDVVTDELHASLHALVSQFLPDAATFLQHLVKWKALIIGEAALSYVLHDPAICSTAFELAVGNLAFQDFTSAVNDILSRTDSLQDHWIQDVPLEVIPVRLIRRIAQFRLTSGRVVAIYESITSSASSVVAGFWSSALINFVTPYTMGCAYPRLTLNHHAILCQARMHTLGWAGEALMGRLVARHWNFGHNSLDWPPYVLDEAGSELSFPVGCGRAIFACPHQGRYFGDNGSLVVFMDTFKGGKEVSYSRNVAPFGLMSAWRIPFPGLCEEECRDTDDVLARDVLCMFVELSADYFEPISQVYCMGTRGVGGSLVVYPPTRRAQGYSF